jgi:hypothetical protein
MGKPPIPGTRFAIRRVVIATACPARRRCAPCAQSLDSFMITQITVILGLPQALLISYCLRNNMDGVATQ